MHWYRGRTVLLTGASGGIGAEMARLLAPYGPTLLLVARSEDALRRNAEALEALGARAVPLVADLSEPSAAAELHARVTEAGHTPDVLVNNAGYGLQGRLEELDPDDLERMLTLNVTTLVGLTRRCLPAMLARGSGGVLNVSSVAGFLPLPYFAAYAASKAFVKDFTEALHAELAGTGVHATCLCPGPTETGFFERAGMAAAPGNAAVASPEQVARDGLLALARNRRVVVSGLANRLMAASAKVTPTGLGLAVGKRMMEATRR